MAVVKDGFEKKLPTGKGSNLGSKGLADPNVAAARRHAASMDGKKVDWAHPAKALEHLTQVDSGRGAQAGGNDAIRCGAATLMAGTVLLGPGQFQAGLAAVVCRADAFAGKLRDMEAHWPAGPGGELAAEVDKASKTLNELALKDPRTLTYGDMKKGQEALYVIANVDQRLSANGKRIDMTHAADYLTTGALTTYQDLLWGGKTPTMNGEPLQQMLVENPTGAAHFVLTNKKGEMAFNPWPDRDGTAFTRAVDGKGPTVSAAGDFQGAEVASEGFKLPARD